MPGPHRKMVTQEESATLSEGEGEGVASKRVEPLAAISGSWVEFVQLPGSWVSSCAAENGSLGFRTRGLARVGSG
jgi:hypothetical protein